MAQRFGGYKGRWGFWSDLIKPPHHPTPPTPLYPTQSQPKRAWMAFPLPLGLGVHSRQQASSQARRLADGYAGRQTDRQTDTGRQTDRQTDRQSRQTGRRAEHPAMGGMRSKIGDFPCLLKRCTVAFEFSLCVNTEEPDRFMSA